ncbi:toxin-antitoxin system HicB family antitoxin [Acinetobacter baumannii]
MKSKEIVYVKVRIESNLHKELKNTAEKDERSMNYLINKAVEFYLNKSGAKA